MKLLKEFEDSLSDNQYPQIKKTKKTGRFGKWRDLPQLNKILSVFKRKSENEVASDEVKSEDSENKENKESKE